MTRKWILVKNALEILAKENCQWLTSTCHLQPEVSVEAAENAAQDRWLETNLSIGVYEQCAACMAMDKVQCAATCSVCPFELELLAVQQPLFPPLF